MSLGYFQEEGEDGDEASSQGELQEKERHTN